MAGCKKRFRTVFQKETVSQVIISVLFVNKDISLSFKLDNHEDQTGRFGTQFSRTWFICRCLPERHIPGRRCCHCPLRPSHWDRTFPRKRGTVPYPLNILLSVYHLKQCYPSERHCEKPSIHSLYHDSSTSNSLFGCSETPPYPSIVT